MFFFTNNKNIKVILKVGIIPGQLWKPFALMNKDGRNWNTFSFLNTRQALVGRIRQQNLCTLVYRWTSVHKTYTSYILFVQHKGYGYSCVLKLVMFPIITMLVQHQHYFYLHVHDLPHTLNRIRKLRCFPIIVYKICFPIMVHKILHRPLAIAMKRNIILFYSSILTYLYKRKCTKTCKIPKNQCF